MTWEDLNSENIDEAKELYMIYIQVNKDRMYRANMETFEEYIGHLHKCRRCGTLIYEDENYCDACKDELFRG